MSLSPTLTRNEKVEHYIRIKTHKAIALRFWVESGVSALYGLAQVSLVLYLPSDTPPYKPDIINQRAIFRAKITNLHTTFYGPKL